MQTQEDHSNQIPALNIDSLKVDLVVIQNTCSEKEETNLETASSKSVKESSLDSATKDVHAIKYKMSKAKERCMAYFRSLHSHLQVLSKENLKGTRIEHGFKRACMSLFSRDVDTFTSTMLLNVHQLQKQLDKDEFQEDGSMTAFWVVNNQFQKFIDSQFTLDYDSQMTDKYFVEYTGIEVKHFRDTLLKHMGNVKKSVAKRIRKAVDDDLVVTGSSGTESEVQDDNNKPGNDTDAEDADIRPIYDKEPMAETIEQKTSLLANNADLKAQIQEKKSVLQSPRKQSVVRQPNAFKSERPQMSKPRFAYKVDVNNNLSRLVTQHYFLTRREFVSAKPDHMIASSESRDSSKNMPRFSSNNMVHNLYLDEARKKTQERYRNSKTNVIPSARFQSTADGSKPKPRSTNHSTRSFPVSKSSCVAITAVPKADHSKSSSSFSDSKHFVCSTCHKCVFNANHDACITKILKFSPNKTSVVYEKTSPRSDLRWKPTGRIFKSVGLRWIPIGKLFDSCTSIVDSEPPHGSNIDILNIHECKQTLAVSAGTSINVQKEQSLDLSAELESLFGHLFEEYFNGVNQVVSNSYAVTATDASVKRQQQPDSTPSTSTLATTVTADGNFDL
ncbi:hypothetical protein Tco_0626325 [Tanacetum coccineum]|uniref:Uncharacterized protein n=1 Tax=Tanacetum coccineum TaxID=301880 RepID=A0ABQ4WJ93_9ASTR